MNFSSSNEPSARRNSGDSSESQYSDHGVPEMPYAGRLAPTEHGDTPASVVAQAPASSGKIPSGTDSIPTRHGYNPRRFGYVPPSPGHSPHSFGNYSPSFGDSITSGNSPRGFGYGQHPFGSHPSTFGNSPTSGNTPPFVNSRRVVDDFSPPFDGSPRGVGYGSHPFGREATALATNLNSLGIISPSLLNDSPSSGNSSHGFGNNSPSSSYSPRAIAVSPPLSGNSPREFRGTASPSIHSPRGFGMSPSLPGNNPATVHSLGSPRIRQSNLSLWPRIVPPSPDQCDARIFGPNPGTAASENPMPVNKRVAAIGGHSNISGPVDPIGRSSSSVDLARPSTHYTLPEIKRDSLSAFKALSHNLRSPHAFTGQSESALSKESPTIPAMWKQSPTKGSRQFVSRIPHAATMPKLAGLASSSTADSTHLHIPKRRLQRSATGLESLDESIDSGRHRRLPEEWRRVAKDERNIDTRKQTSDLVDLFQSDPPRAPPTRPATPSIKRKDSAARSLRSIFRDSKPKDIPDVPANPAMYLRSSSSVSLLPPPPPAPTTWRRPATPRAAPEHRRAPGAMPAPTTPTAWPRKQSLDDGTGRRGGLHRLLPRKKQSMPNLGSPSLPTEAPPSSLGGGRPHQGPAAGSSDTVLEQRVTPSGRKYTLIRGDQVTGPVLGAAPETSFTGRRNLHPAQSAENIRRGRPLLVAESARIHPARREAARLRGPPGPPPTRPLPPAPSPAARSEQFGLGLRLQTNPAAEHDQASGRGEETRSRGGGEGGGPTASSTTVARAAVRDSGPAAASREGSPVLGRRMEVTDNPHGGVREQSEESSGSDALRNVSLESRLRSQRVIRRAAPTPSRSAVAVATRSQGRNRSEGRKLQKHPERETGNENDHSPEDPGQLVIRGTLHFPHDANCQGTARGRCQCSSMMGNIHPLARQAIAAAERAQSSSSAESSTQLAPHSEVFSTGVIVAVGRSPIPRPIRPEGRVGGHTGSAVVSVRSPGTRPRRSSWRRRSASLPTAARPLPAPTHRPTGAPATPGRATRPPPLPPDTGVGRLGSRAAGGQERPPKQQQREHRAMLVDTVSSPEDPLPNDDPFANGEQLERHLSLLIGDQFEDFDELVDDPDSPVSLIPAALKQCSTHLASRLTPLATA